LFSGPFLACPILSLESHSPICYAHRSVQKKFLENSINEDHGDRALPERGKIAILTPKTKTLQPADRGKIAICSPTRTPPSKAAPLKKHAHDKRGHAI
jgi:hypothetical protein